MAPGAYPAREVRLVAPFPEGHVTDLHARLLAPHMAEALSQEVIVDNWAGESGTVAGAAMIAPPIDRRRNPATTKIATPATAHRCPSSTSTSRPKAPTRRTDIFLQRGDLW